MEKYPIVEHNSQNGYWVKEHIFLKLTSVSKHNLRKEMNQEEENQQLIKTYCIKDDANVLYYFVIVDKPPYTQFHLESYINRIFREEGELIKMEIHNGLKGYWVNAKQLAEILNSSSSVVTKSTTNGTLHPSIFFDKKSPRKFSYFVTIEDEPYTSEQALNLRNELLLTELEREMPSLNDMPSWKEMKKTILLFKENPGLPVMLEWLAKQKQKDMEEVVQIAKKVNKLFDPVY